MFLQFILIQLLSPNKYNPYFIASSNYFYLYNLSNLTFLYPNKEIKKRNELWFYDSSEIRLEFL